MGELALALREVSKSEDYKKFKELTYFLINLDSKGLQSEENLIMATRYFNNVNKKVVRLFNEKYLKLLSEVVGLPKEEVCDRAGKFAYDFKSDLKKEIPHYEIVANNHIKSLIQGMNEISNIYEFR